MSDMTLISEHRVLFEILSHLNESVYVIDDKMEIVYVNDSAHRKGFDQEQVLNQSIFKVFPNLQRENSSFVYVFEHGKPVIGSICTFITERSERKTMLTSTYPIFKSGVVVGAYEIGEDISGISKLSESFILQNNLHKKDDLLTLSSPVDAYYTLNDIIGISEHIRTLKEGIVEAALNPSNVLIYGETGTGKEMVAQAIYTLFRKDDRTPFIAQNCAAIPETLLESILFGTVKGSFTGAENRPGLFELANEGVLFLDEINSMQQSLQAKILRVIQEGSVRRVGGDREIPIRVKLVASTNVDPNQLIATGELRRDLYYRLNVFYLEMQPLRMRKQDLPSLVQHFITDFNHAIHKQVVGVDQETLDYFELYDWPGNIRELRNLIERLMYVSKQRLIRYEDVKRIAQLKTNIIASSQLIEPKCSTSDRVRLKEALAAYEIELIKEALEASTGNVSKAARDLDLPQQTLNNKIQKYDLGQYVKQSRR